MSTMDLHPHEDIEDAAKFYNIPRALWNEGDVYILQGDRIVFIGKPGKAENWIKQNTGKYCKLFYKK